MFLRQHWRARSQFNSLLNQIGLRPYELRNRPGPVRRRIESRVTPRRFFWNRDKKIIALRRESFLLCETQSRACKTGFLYTSYETRNESPSATRRLKHALGSFFLSPKFERGGKRIATTFVGRSCWRMVGCEQVRDEFDGEACIVSF